MIIKLTLFYKHYRTYLQTVISMISKTINNYYKFKMDFIFEIKCLKIISTIQRKINIFMYIVYYILYIENSSFVECNVYKANLKRVNDI